MMYFKNFVKLHTIVFLAILFCVPIHAQTDEKQKAFEWVFGDLVKLDPDMVQKVLNDTHGKRHYVDKDGDGKPEEVWFIDISPRHRADKRPVLVRVIDEGGNLRMGEEPGYAGFLYVADWNANGTVDGVIEYKDIDGDGDVDEMAIFFYNPWISKGLSVWWGRDDGDDNLLWYDIDYIYDQSHCQNFTHFGGDETFSLFAIQPGEKYWAPKIEIPFLFYDHDGDGVTEEVLCVFGDEKAIYALRHSFDLDNDATKDSPRDFDVSLSAYAPGWTFEEHGMGNAFELILDPNKGSNYHLIPNAQQSESLTIRGIPSFPIIKRKAAETFFKNVVWGRVLMTWDENDLNIGDSDFERWEGVIPSSSLDKGFEFPQIGGPPCGSFNKRYELVLNPATANEFYFSPSDSRIHIKHSDRTWIKVDYDYDRKADMYYLWTDTNNDGILDKIEVDIDGDCKFDDSWTIDVSSVQPVQWNFWDLNSIYAPVIVHETPLVYQLNRTLQKAAKTIFPNAEKAPAWQMIENKMRTEALSKELSERLLNSDASMLYYMRIAADYEIAGLKKAYKNKSFWKNFNVARSKNDLPEMVRLIGETFKISPVADNYSDWVKDLRKKPSPGKRTAWDNTWLPPNWGWESEKAAFRFYDGHFDLFGKRVDTLIYPVAVKSGMNYHKDHSTWGMDILHVGETGGCGGLILYVDNVAYPVVRNVDGDPVFSGRLLKETPDTVSLGFTATGVGPKDEPYKVNIKVSAISGRYDSPVEVTVEGNSGRSLKLGIGINVLPTERFFMDKISGIMGSWGFQDPEIGWIGTGVIFPSDRYLYSDEQPDEHRVVLKYNAGETVRYHIRGDWLRAHRFPVAPGVREWKETLIKTAAEVKQISQSCGNGLPKTDAPGKYMKFEKVVMPSKNFNILGHIKIKDPKDGKEKIVMHTYSAAKCGMLVIFDPDDLTGESYETPGDFGSWALCEHDGALLIGTCPKAALIYHFDLKSRKFKGEPAKAPGVTYIWNLDKASDGLIYGGTYAECRLMRYDPATYTITDLGRVDPDENNWYSRKVYGSVPGKVFIDCGYSTKRIFIYDLQTKTFSQFYKDGYQISYLTEDFACVVSDNNEYEFIDLKTGKKYHRISDTNETKTIAQDPRLAASKLHYAYTLENGDMVGFQGQEIYILRKSALEPEFHQYPVTPPVTCAFGVNVDDDGKIWGSSSFGMTVFCYDPKTGETFNTLDVSTLGGECYGVVPYGGKLYFTAYAGGGHIVFDPKEPWNMRANINPKTVYTVAPDYIRPHTRSITNGDGVIWTGWMAKYGAYGGAITRWDVNSGEIKLFPDLIPENTIEALTIHKDAIIFVTAKSGNGLPSVHDVPKYICKMTFDGKIVQKNEVDKSPGSLCVNGERGVISTGGELCLFNPETLEIQPLGIKLSGAQIRKFKNNLIAVGKENCYIINQNNGDIILKTGGVGTHFNDVCVNGNDVWAVGDDGWLYRMTIE